MSPTPRRWNDQAIDEVASTVRTFAPTVGTVAHLEAEVDLLKERVNRMEDARRTVVLSLMGFAITISMALIGSATTLVLHFT